MHFADFQRLLASVQSLMPAQPVVLDEAIRVRIASSPARAAAPTPTIATIEARFSNAPRRPHCKSTPIKKWGSANGLKRYRCRECKATFVVPKARLPRDTLTVTPPAQLHKRELWTRHAAALLVSRDAVLVSDGAGAYRAFAGKAHIPHVGLVLSQGERTWGIYHVQNVNAYTSRLKVWMRRFNGVATKYLDSYPGWRRMNDRDAGTLTANRIVIAAMG